MQDRISVYLDKITQKFNSGHAIEHAYRGALQDLMESFGDTDAINDPKHSQYGAPDFVFLKKNNTKIIQGYAEAKDVTVSLDKTEKSEQMRRYAGYANLFLTDYLEFRFFKNGEKYETISLGHVKDGVLHITPENGDRLVREIQAFLELPPERIRSGRRLAEIMGGKARRIRDNVTVYLVENNERNGELEKIYGMMKELLVHDLEQAKFADMYAQTLVYGLFVARYGDSTPDSFSRAEARDLVPRSNPFLMHFFDHIVGPSFDTRLGYIVDELCEIFSVSDVRDIVHKHLRIQDETQDIKDPIIHFYEDFLQAYDPAERKRMGAYYTPIPVVQFIVRHVDKILKEDFGIAQGLASSEKVTQEVDTQPWRQKGDRKDRLTKTVIMPRVQVLDPAVGTATFLNETIKYIYKGFKGQEGRWPSYVKDNLIPRLYGFELMMAPYTIAHLKLGMTYKETGVEKLEGRLGVYLTNTLEEGVPHQPDLFNFGLAEAVSEESRLAAEVKNERPVVVIMGNPPYSGVSSNETKYANQLIAKYKVEPGGKQKLQERKHWLNDDYVKFIAFAEDMVEKNGSGVVAMITNNGYLDNPTFRGMRWHLSKTFDKIYILDLHGNYKKNEISPDGGKDENVFDIMQGVGIILAVKNNENKSGELAKIYHSDLYGQRKDKFASLAEDIVFTQILPEMKSMYFIPKSTEGQDEYNNGISVDSLFKLNVTGIVTMGDSFIIDTDKNVIIDRIQKLAAGGYSESSLNWEFGLGKNYAKFVLENAPRIQFDESKVIELDYRPFDTRWTYFDNKVLWRWRENVMRHFIGHENIGLVTTRLQKENPGAYISSKVIAHKVFNSYDSNSVFPLYLYQDDGSRVPNFDHAQLRAFTEKLSKPPSPENLLDYIYAILHSPQYLEKYKEFLKTDFPRITLPVSDNQFSRMTTFGKQLRDLHLMKSSIIDEYHTIYPESGDNLVNDAKYDDSRVYINDTQYFGNVPQVAWDFYIGGYQPARKWLKDRKNQKLTNEDLNHYQQIIKVLLETDRIMREIDQV